MEKFIKENLLRPIYGITRDNNQVEIVHKSLPYDWPRLNNWIEGYREAQRYLSNIDEDIYRWEHLDKDSRNLMLLSQKKIETLEDYVKNCKITLNTKEQAYIDASKAHIKQEQEEKNRLKFRSIIQALVAHARLQQERYKENQRGALLAYQAYIFNKRYRNFSDAYLGALLSEILNVSYFSRVLKGHEGDIPAIAFSSDGKTLASGSSDGTILLWDIPSGRRETLDTQKNKIEIKSLVFHPKNSQWLVSGTTDGRVQLWDLSQTVPKPSTLYRHKGRPPENNKPEVWALAFNSDGTLLASGSWDCTILLWDFQKQKLLRPLEGHNDFIWSVAFSPDGTMLASGSRDGTVLLWDLNQHKAQPQRLSVHQEEINHDYEVFSVAFSPDGTMLASGCRDHVVRLWSLKPSANNWIVSDSPVVLTSHYKEVRSVAFHPDPDTKLLASGSNDQTVRLWDLRSLTSKSSIVTSPTVLDCQDTGVSSVAFSANGEFLAASSWNRKLELWDLRRPVTVFSGTSLIYSVTVSSDEEWVFWGDEAGNINGWKQDLVYHHPTILGSHKKTVRSVAFSPDKQMLASGSLDGTVQLWQLNTLNSKLTKLGLDLGYCEQGFQSVVFSKNGQWLAAGDRNRTVWLWNLSQPGSAPFKESLTFPSSVPHDQREIYWVCSVAFSPDSEMLASGHGDGTVRLWRVSQHSIKQEIVNGHNHHQQEVRVVAFSPYGRWLASASADRTVQLWHRREEKLYVLYGANSGFSSISFSPEGDLLAVGCFDGTIWLWDVNYPYATPIVLPRRHNAGVSSVSFSPNGQKLVSGSHDGTVRIWNMDVESLANLICERVQRNLTQDEWNRFVDFGIEYLRTCPNLPSGEDAPPNAQSSEDWLKNALPLTDL